MIYIRIHEIVRTLNGILSQPVGMI